MDNEALAKHIATALMPVSVDPGLHQKTFMLIQDSIASFKPEPDAE